MRRRMIIFLSRVGVLFPFYIAWSPDINVLMLYVKITVLFVPDSCDAASAHVMRNVLIHVWYSSDTKWELLNLMKISLYNLGQNICMF